MDTVQRCPIDTRKALLGNIFLIGGNCSTRGFASRLKTELQKLAWEGARSSIKIDAHDTETAMYPYDSTIPTLSVILICLCLFSHLKLYYCVLFCSFTPAITSIMKSSYLGGTVLTDEYHERMEQFVSKEDFDDDASAAMKRLFPHSQ